MTESLEKQREELTAIVTEQRARSMEAVSIAREALRLARGSRRPIAKELRQEIRRSLTWVRRYSLLLEDIPNKPEEEIAFLLDVFRKAHGRYRP